MALLILCGALDAPGSSILAIEYAPPLRSRRDAPPSLRQLTLSLDASAIASLIGTEDAR